MVVDWLISAGAWCGAYLGGDRESCVRSRCRGRGLCLACADRGGGDADRDAAVTPLGLMTEIQLASGRARLRVVGTRYGGPVSGTVQLLEHGTKLQSLRLPDGRTSCGLSKFSCTPSAHRRAAHGPRGRSCARALSDSDVRRPSRMT